MRRGRRKGASKDRVFGCDLLEHLAASSQEIPQVLRCCSEFIEEHGVVDGIYRLSGVSSNTQKLRGEFDGEGTPDLSKEVYLQDIHCVSSLCKAYFRELPNPLLTYQLYDKFADAVALQLEEERLVKIKEVLKDLPAPHYRTLEFLMRHLVKMATFASETNMHSRNLAIVWAPNLLRSKDIEATGLNGTAAFMEVRVQSIVVEFILTHVSQLFSGPEGHTPERRKSLPSPSASSNQEDPFSRSIPRNVPSALGSGNGPPAMRSYHAIIDGTDKRRGSLKGRKWKSIFNLGGRLQDPRRKNKAPCKAEKEKTSLRPAKSMDSLSSLPHTPEEKELAYGTYGPRQHPFLSPLTHPCPTLGREVGSAGGANSRYAVTYRRGGGACVSVVSGGGVHGTYSRLDSREANDGGGPPPPSRSAGVASRAERRAGMHISGPYSVTVPLHIASGLGQVLGGARHEEGGDPKEGGGAHKEGGGAHNEGGRAQREEVRAHMEEGGAHKEGGGAHREEGRACQEGGRAHREENGGSHSEEGGEVSTEDKSREGEVEGEKTVNRSEESRGEEGMTEHLSVEEEAATEDHEYMDIRGGFFTKEQDSQLPLDFQDTFGFLDLMDSSACNQANEFSVESPCYEEEDVYEEHSGYQGDAPSISTPEQPAQLPLTHRPLTLDLHGKPCKSHSLPLKSRPFLPALSITSSEEEEEDKEDEEEEGSVEEEDMLYYSLPSSLKFREAKEGAHKMADTDGPPTAERELEADACCDVSATSSVNISDQSEGELGHGVDGIDWQVALDRPEEMREDGTKEEDSPELKKKMGEEETGEREHTIGLRNTHGFGCGGGESGTAESEDQKGHEDHRGPEQNERDHTARNTEPKERDHKPEHMEPKERDHTAEHKEPKERDHSAELTESKERDHTAEQLTESKERDHTAELTESKERDHTAEQLTEPKERDHTAEQLTESKERDHIAGHTESKERDHTAEQLTEPKERDHTAGHTESKERDHSAELTESKERDHTAEQLTESKERDHTAELTESKERDHTAEQLTEPKERDHTAEQLTESKERDHIAEQLTESKERDHTAEQLTESKERDHTAELTESKERDHTAGHTESEERDHTAEQLTESKERDHSAELIESEERDHTADKLTESKERDHTAEFIESKERDHTAEFIESEERDHTAEFIESEERDHTAEHTESKERDHIAGHQESKERDHTAELIESKERDHTAELIESKERDHTAEHTESEERDHTAGHQESKERDHTARHTESEERDHTAEQLNDTGLESSAEDHRRRSQEDPYGSPGDSASGTKPAAESTECGKTPEPCPPPLPEPLQGPDTCAHLPPEPPATPGEREDTCREEGGERELEGGRGEGREREEEVEDGLGDGGGEREVEGQRKGRRENSMESQNHLVGQEKEERNGKRDETQERKVTLGEPERGREERDLRTKSENAHKHKTQPDKGERDEERSKGGEGDRGWGATQGRSAREEGLREARLPGVARKLVRSKQATPILYQAKAVPVVPPKPQLCKLTALTLRQQRGTARGREGAGDRDGERALGWAREKEDWRRGEIERREKEQERDRDAERAPGLNEEREEWRRGEMVRRERERGREGAGDIDEERAPGWDQEREEQRTGEVQREKERGRGGAGDMDRERVSSRDGERGERRRAEVEREGERGREGGKEGELERWGEGGRSPEKETKRNSGASVCFDVAVARATERREKERERGKDGQTEGRRGAEKVERNERSRGDEADRREAGENNWRKRKEKEMEGGKERESDRE